MAATTQAAIDRSTAKEISKMRVNIFLFALTAIVGAESLLEELSMTREYLSDDIILVLVGVIAAMLFLKWRKSRVFAEVIRANNLFLVLALVLIAGIGIAFFLEGGNSDAVADDIPLIPLAVGLIANRFW